MKPKPQRAGNWLVQLALLIPGVVLLLFGYFEWRHKYFWHVSFNERFGRPGFVPALWLMALGALFTLSGIVPWQRISDWLETRNTRHNRK
jgi:hypothetical protein